VTEAVDRYPADAVRSYLVEQKNPKASEDDKLFSGRIGVCYELKDGMFRVEFPGCSPMILVNPRAHKIYRMWHHTRISKPRLSVMEGRGFFVDTPPMRGMNGEWA
jgi:hypothetical protein